MEINMADNILPFPTPDHAERLEPNALAQNAPLLVAFDADLARTDIAVDLARRKLTVRGAANAARAAEKLWDELSRSQRL
jgi:hypothetical protein